MTKKTEQEEGDFKTGRKDCWRNTHNWRILFTFSAKGSNERTECMHECREQTFFSAQIPFRRSENRTPSYFTYKWNMWDWPASKASSAEHALLEALLWFVSFFFQRLFHVIKIEPILSTTMCFKKLPMKIPLLIEVIYILFFFQNFVNRKHKSPDFIPSHSL